MVLSTNDAGAIGTSIGTHMKNEPQPKPHTFYTILLKTGLWGKKRIPGLSVKHTCNHISHKALDLEYIKNSKNNSKQTIRKWAKDIGRLFTEEGTQVTSTWKDIQQC